MPKRNLALLLMLLPGLFLAACAALQEDAPLPVRHPYELPQGRPLCTECHEERGERVHFRSFNHTPLFADSHRQRATQGARVCSMCHATAFCNDCHAVRAELKPSIKNQTDNYRRMPHRGEYRSRHMIDGRIDPTSCFRCHGNPKSAMTCAPCHG